MSQTTNYPWAITSQSCIGTLKEMTDYWLAQNGIYFLKEKTFSNILNANFSYSQTCCSKKSRRRGKGKSSQKIRRRRRKEKNCDGRSQISHAQRV